MLRDLIEPTVRGRRRTRPALTVALGLLGALLVGAGPAPADTMDAPAVPTGTVHRYSDVVLSNDGSYTPRSFTGGEPATGWAAPSGTVGAGLLPREELDWTSYDFGGLGRERSVVVGRCQVTTGISTSMCISTGDTPAGGMTAPVAVPFGTLDATTPETRIRIAAGRFAGGPGVAIAWLEKLGTSKLLRVGILRAAGSPLGTAWVSNGVIDVATMPIGTVDASCWSGGSAPPTSSSRICDNRFPFAIDVAALNGGTDEQVVVAYEASQHTQLAFVSPGSTSSLQMSTEAAAGHDLWGQYTTKAGPRADRPGWMTSIDIDAVPAGAGVAADDAKPALVIGYGWETPINPLSPTDPGFLSINDGNQQHGYGVELRSVTWPVGGSATTAFDRRPYESKITSLAFAGDVRVAVADIAPALDDDTFPVGVSATEFGLPTLPLWTGGSMAPGTYYYRYAWVHTSAAGSRVSDLRPAPVQATVPASTGGALLSLRLSSGTNLPAGYALNLYRTHVGTASTSTYYFVGQMKPDDASSGIYVFNDTFADSQVDQPYAPSFAIPDGKPEIVVARSVPVTAESLFPPQVYQIYNDGGLNSSVFVSALRWSDAARGGLGDWVESQQTVRAAFGLGGIPQFDLAVGNAATPPVRGADGNLVTTVDFAPDPNRPNRTVLPHILLSTFSNTVAGSPGGNVSVDALQFAPTQLRLLSVFRGTAPSTFPTTIQIPLGGTVDAPWSPFPRHDATTFAAPDTRGVTVRIGAPRTMRVAGVLRPLVVLRAPPLLFDRLPDRQTAGAWRNLDNSACFPAQQFQASGACWGGTDLDFFTRLETTQTTDIESQVTRSADWKVGAKVKLEVSGGGGGVTQGIEAEMSARYGQGFENTAGTSVTSSIKTSANAGLSDLVIADTTTYQIDEYPVYGAGENAVDGTPVPVDSIVVVTPVETVRQPHALASPDVVIDQPQLYGYLHDHIQGNPFSYPWSASEVLARSKSGTAVAPQGMSVIPGVPGFLDEVEFGKVDTSKLSAKESGGASVELTRKASAKVEIPNVIDIDVSGSVSLSGDYDFSNMRDVKTSLTSGQKVTFKTGAGDASYDVFPYVYWDKAGVLTADYSTSLATAGCSSPFNTAYGGSCASGDAARPDPGFPLPFRMLIAQPRIGGTANLGGWTGSSRSQALFTPNIDLGAATEADTQSVTGSCAATPGALAGAPPCSAVKAGGDGVLTAAVRNYSYRAAATGSAVRTRFFLADSTADYQDVGIPVADGQLCAAGDVCLPGFGAGVNTRVVTAPWAIPDALGGRKVRIAAVIDPGNSLPEIHDWTTPFQTAGYQERLWPTTDTFANGDSDTSVPDIPNNQGWRDVVLGGAQAASADLAIANSAAASDVQLIPGVCGTFCASVTVHNRSAVAGGRFTLVAYDGDPRVVASLDAARLGSVVVSTSISGAGQGTFQIPVIRQPSSALHVVLIPGTTFDPDLRSNIADAAPVNSTPVALGAPLTPGDTAQCNPGAWTRTPQLSVAWALEGAPTTGSALIRPVTAAEAMHRITCIVTGTVLSGSRAVTSNAVVIGPSITGTTALTHTVSCNVGDWGGDAPLFEYRWKLGTGVVSGQVEPTFDINDQSMVGKQLSCGARPAGSNDAFVDSKQAQIQDIPGPKSTGVTVTGQLAPGDTATCSPGTWTPGSPTLTFAWKRDGQAIAGASGSTFGITRADAMHLIACVVTGSDGAFANAFASDGVRVRPVVDGDPATGKSVTCYTGEWNGASPTFSFAWSVDDATEPGATGKSFAIPSGAGGKQLACLAQADATGFVKSAAVTVRTVITPTTTGVSLTEPLRPGTTATCSPGAWTPSSAALTYAWTRDGVALGTTSSMLVLTAADAMHVIRCAVTGTTADTSATVTSREVRVAPSVVGTAETGKTVTCHTGEWGGGAPDFTFRWSLDSASQAGQTDPVFTIPASAGGKKLACSASVDGVTYLKSADVVVSKVIPPASDPVNTDPPYILGASVAPGAILNCMPGTWTPPSATLSYQWLRNGTAVPGATGRTYVYKAADRTSALSCRVTATAAGRSASADTPAIDGRGITSGIVITDQAGQGVVPITVTKRLKGCDVRMRLQAYRPATLSMTLFLKGKKPVRIGKAVVRHYRAAGIQSVCYRLPKKPKGWYRKRKLYWQMGVKLGFAPAPGAHTSTHKVAVKIRL